MNRHLIFSTVFVTSLTLSADQVTDWNLLATDVVRAAGVDDLNQPRTLAMMHIAIHDALNAIDRRFTPYLTDRTAESGTVAEAAVAAAAHDTLLALVPSQKNEIDAAYQRTLAEITDSPQKTAGVRLGQSAAAAILMNRLSDRSDDTSAVAVIGTMPGQWRPTPPELFPSFLPGWGNVTPFAMESTVEHRAPPPPNLMSDRYAADYNEIKRLGVHGSTERTAEQSEIARFWYEVSAQGWNRIARTALEGRPATQWDTARLFALLNMALADSYIASLETKNFFNFWRPVTAIRDGEVDGNPNTAGSSNWSSYLFTPPVPDWPSGHSSAGGASAEVLARWFSNDFVPFSLTSGAPYPGITREFYSFSDAALENANSRTLAGIHFRSANIAGLEQGRKIGEYVMDNFLRPVPR